ncbi:MAG: hypothetical protein J6I35_07310 [Ruminobacter sp.]|uniref:hypothetical protein n=1 Tax=Ruminobacter sp. TaxID=2774296 RepID=UPI001B507AA6|nr:hypothetical protein [Ruminobacter sp.]MBP3749340.1 hypothetical protein [Ruminobacter sp.]
MDNRFITSMLLGTLLFCCHGQAEAFDKEAAEKLLNSGSAAVGTDSVNQEERNFIESSKREIRQQNEKKDVKVILPDECSLISYTSDGVSSRYKCGGYEILTIITFPPENLSTEQIVKQLSEVKGCEAMPQNTLGLSVGCDTDDGKYISYFIDLPTKLRENLITSADYNDPSKIESISNVSHSIYFYMRRIAKDEEQIKYLTDILNMAARITVTKKEQQPVTGNNNTAVKSAGN